MQKALLCLLSLVLIFSTGCLKKNAGCSYSISNTIAPSSEQTDLSNYLSTNSITNATKYTNGMYYQIITQGSGSSPNLCSQLTVNYTGQLTNGNTFDSQTGIKLTLGALIEGWKTGLPLIQKGGHIKLYIPPSLGYGSADVKDGSTVIIPANSILIFDISLMDFN
jgi:FKBP-type peptidyl-prolyl cis-trans isomerase FkpA